MQKEIAAALKAANAYKARSDNESIHVDFIRALLSDAATRAGFLDDYQSEHDLRVAQEAYHAQVREASLGLEGLQSGGVPKASVSTAPAADDASAG